MGEARRVQIEAINPLNLDAAARQRLQAQLLVVMDAVFPVAQHGCLPPAELERPNATYCDWAFDPHLFSRYQRTLLFREAGALVGLAHTFVQIVEIEGQPVELIRFVSGFLPAFRSSGLLALSYRRLVMDYARHHGLSRMPRYCVGVCMSPIPYSMMVRYARHILPTPHGDADARLRAVFAAVHKSKPADPHPEPVRSDDPDDDVARPDAHQSLGVRFFLKHNPRFAEGFSLPFVARVEVSDLLYALGVSLERRLRRALPGLRRRR